MYQEGSLRPPTPKEMEDRFVPLEEIHVEWEYDCWDDTHCRYVGVHTDDTPRTFGTVHLERVEPTVGALIEFCKDNGIPYGAVVVPDGYDGELALTWRHMTECPACKGWYAGSAAEHDGDELHRLITRRSRKAQILEELEHRTKDLERELNGVADEMSWHDIHQHEKASAIWELVKELRA